jgi:hypothetical protein
MEIDPNCKYCETYFTSRNEFIKQKEHKFGDNAKYLFPLNSNCENPYCKTIKKLTEEIVDKYYEEFSSDDTFAGCDVDKLDNWDMEPNIKLYRKKINKNQDISDLQGLIKKLNINNGKSSFKKRKMRQKKITEYDINHLLNHLRLK